MAQQVSTVGQPPIVTFDPDDQPGELYRANLVNAALNNALPALLQQELAEVDSEGGDL